MRERVHVTFEEDCGYVAKALDYPRCPQVTGASYEEAIRALRVPLLIEKAIRTLETQYEGKAA
jgi:predicted RNase H-like HicB family nuclease